DRAVAVLVEADLDSSRSRLDACCQVARLLLCVEVAHNAILSFPTRLQHGVLVGEGQPLEARVLDPDVVEDAAVVQDVPADGRPDRPEEAAGTEQAAEILGRPAERAEEGEVWVEVGFGDADEGALCRDLAFGPADVRSPAQEVG